MQFSLKILQKISDITIHRMVFPDLKIKHLGMKSFNQSLVRYKLRYIPLPSSFYDSNHSATVVTTTISLTKERRYESVLDFFQLIGLSMLTHFDLCNEHLYQQTRSVGDNYLEYRCGE
jgi:hypothetical protein